MHTINIGTRAVFVFANRYAPDQFEGLLPDALEEHIDLYSRGGVVGKVNVQNQMIGVATRVRVWLPINLSAGTQNAVRHVYPFCKAWKQIFRKYLTSLADACPAVTE